MRKKIFLSLLMFSSFIFATPNENLFEGIRTNDLNKVRVAVAAGADVNSGIGPCSICDPLALAVDSMEIFRFLLDHGADVHKEQIFEDRKIKGGNPTTDSP